MKIPYEQETEINNNEYYSVVANCYLHPHDEFKHIQDVFECCEKNEKNNLDKYSIVINAGGNKMYDWRVVICECFSEHTAKEICKLLNNDIKKTNLLFKNWNNLSYSDYLKSDRWKSLSVEAKQKAGNKCQMCSNTHRLETHHRDYKNKGTDREVNDLIVLCHSCHSKFHKK